ncbi:glycosyltransferase family 2 protein [Phocaeicola dorei]|uniref:glycosyltransferase family 2 protein n=1 Tax=Phocaeicola dorei TaxID=357276 RepID=UPI001D07AE22|nr:glycosyltransferase family 2 protein [Phocaeicola dorei]MCB6965193.1 glycosyltransferase family 2 protein [Phocaeicola dorei]MCG4614552.1 glycosyltransferase family 2 protein [Phocaeicola dorei]MCG4637917.1 glycosyltransferase family 2 protein [Phocaeicola dorei]
MKVVVVLPAYNCAKSLKKTISEIPQDVVNEIVLVDDFSSDDTLGVAEECCIKHIIKHDRNLGYGANQKTCYDTALMLDADIIVMLHPDYQYDPKLITLIIDNIFLIPLALNKFLVKL